MQQTTDIDVIESLDGRDIDITIELRRLIEIGRYYRADDILDPDDRKFVHRTGWGLTQVCDPDAPLDLVDDMVDHEERNPPFAAYLRSRSTAIIAKYAA